MYYIFLPWGLSGVTSYYVNIITDALHKAGFKTKEVRKTSEIPTGSNVLTISDKGSWLCGIKRSPKNIISWYQGIIPEEMDMLYKGKWNHRAKIWIHRLMERYSLKHCSLNLFVSEAMKEHFGRHYAYSGNNDAIMPCFGNDIDNEAFTADQYSKPRFLYSGSIVEWQCVEEMLELFKLIKQRVPDATLSILTPARDKAQALTKKLGVEASIDFVEPDKLQHYIRQFKYGFIVRNDIDINRVATPTKMSNYMGAGIIPIYSDVVKDYQKHITAKNPYVIAFNTFEECVDKVSTFEATQPSAELIKEAYRQTFAEYWNREKYVNYICDKIKKYHKI